MIHTGVIQINCRHKMVKSGATDKTTYVRSVEFSQSSLNAAVPRRPLGTQAVQAFTSVQLVRVSKLLTSGQCTHPAWSTCQIQ